LSQKARSPPRVRKRANSPSPFPSSEYAVRTLVFRPSPRDQDSFFSPPPSFSLFPSLSEKTNAHQPPFIFFRYLNASFNSSENWVFPLFFPPFSSFAKVFFPLCWLVHLFCAKVSSFPLFLVRVMKSYHPLLCKQIKYSPFLCDFR